MIFFSSAWSFANAVSGTVGAVGAVSNPVAFVFPFLRSSLVVIVPVQVCLQDYHLRDVLSIPPSEISCSGCPLVEFCLVLQVKVFDICIEFFLESWEVDCTWMVVVSIPSNEYGVNFMHWC